MTPLHKAAIFGHLAVVKRLCEMGAHVNDGDLNGDTTLHYASKCGFPLIVKFLLDYGAGLTKNSGGLSAKDVAITPAIQQLFP